MIPSRDEYSRSVSRRVNLGLQDSSSHLLMLKVAGYQEIEVDGTIL